MSGRDLDRRGFLMRGLAAASTPLLAGCDDISNQPTVRRVLESAETLTRVTQRAILTPDDLAPVEPHLPGSEPRQLQQRKVRPRPEPR